MKTTPPPKRRAVAAPRKAGKGSKRVENKTRTKEQILEAALKLFRKHGMEGTTTKQISQKAGIAEGTLFNYFKTKEDLALFFFQKGTANSVRLVSRATRNCGGPPCQRSCSRSFTGNWSISHLMKTFIGAAVLLPFVAARLPNWARSVSIRRSSD